MELYKRILATGILSVVIGLTSCNPNPETLEGTVKEEFGTAQGLVESSGALFGNESVKISDPVYGLILESDGKEYIITIENESVRPVTSLAKAIEPGDRVEIKYDPLGTFIGKDGIGVTPSHTVYLIGKAK